MILCYKHSEGNVFSLVLYSFILSALFNLLNKIYGLYYESYTAKAISRFSSLYKRCLLESRIWAFIKKQDVFSEAWAHSCTYRLLTRPVNFLVIACGKLYAKFEDRLLNLFIFQVLKKILIRFERVIGLLLAFMLVAPHNYWYNEFAFIIAFVLVFLFFIKAIIFRHEEFNLKALDFALLVFAITVLLAQVMSIQPRESAKFFVFYVISFIILIVIISSIKTDIALERIIEILLFAVAVTSLYAIWQSIMGVPFDASLTNLNLNEGMPGRVYSTMGNPNNYAEILLMFIPFHIALFLNTSNILKRLILFFIGCLSLVALMQTGARMAWISIIPGFMIFVFFKNRRLIPLMIAAGILAYPLLPDSVIMRISTIGNLSDSSTLYRFKILDAFMPMLKTFWYTGLGVGTDPFISLFRKYFEFTYAKDVIDILEPTNRISNIDWYISADFTPPHTHNLFLQIWIEMGVLGITSFLWFVARMVKNCIKNITSRTNEKINNILLAGVASLTGILGMGMAEYIWFYPRVMFFFWVDVAIVLSALAIVAKKREGLSKNSN